MRAPFSVVGNAVFVPILLGLARRFFLPSYPMEPLVEGIPCRKYNDHAECVGFDGGREMRRNGAILVRTAPFRPRRYGTYENDHTA
jgi:hypothetical protein